MKKLLHLLSHLFILVFFAGCTPFNQLSNIDLASQSNAKNILGRWEKQNNCVPHNEFAGYFEKKFFTVSLKGTVLTSEIHANAGCTQLAALAFDYTTYTAPEGNLDEVTVLDLVSHEGWAVIYDQNISTQANNNGHPNLLGMPFQPYNHNLSMASSFKIDSTSSQLSLSFQYTDLTDAEVYNRVSQATDITESLGFYSSCSDTFDPSNDMLIQIATDGKYIVFNSPLFTSHDATCTGPEINNLSTSSSMVIGTDGPILTGQTRTDTTAIGTYLSWASNLPSNQDMTNFCGAPLGFSISANVGYDFTGICGQPSANSTSYNTLKVTNLGLSFTVPNNTETGNTPSLRAHTTIIDIQKASWMP